MRASLNNIQQTLTPEAAAVLNQSIAEASRRNHGQTTPLHVAAMLLASPSGYLRQACIRSHPNSSHPLQCRALELCFSVALERLPTAQSAGDAEPPISNALMAALKRAQAHQRRGCPEQQQQPLLAVKVELEQLVISILDDPGVSRVMREASFSSSAVKAKIEQSLNSSSPRASQRQHHGAGGSANFVVGFGGIASRMLPNPGQPPTPVARPMSPAVPSLANRSLFLNPHMQQQQQTRTAQIENPRGEEVKKVFDIMSSSKKRNPVIVGDSEPEAVVKELFRKIENNEFGNDLNMKNLQIISVDKSLLLSDKNQIAAKIDEFERAIESKIGNGGVILDLGDLRWLVEQPADAGFSGAQQQQKAPVVSELGRALVVEMSKLLARFNGADGLNEGKNKLWLIGTATCDTYLRCQVYHPTMESDWDLQAVPITSRSPIPGMFPRVGPERTMSNPLESLNPANPIRSPSPTLATCLTEISDPATKQPVPNPLPALSGRISTLDPSQIHPKPSPLPGLSRLIPENLDHAQRQTVPSPLPGLARLIPEKFDPAQRQPSPSPLPGLAAQRGPMSNSLPGLSTLKPENSNPAKKQPMTSPLPGLSRLIPENSVPAQIQPMPSPLPGLSRLIPENSNPAQRHPIPSPLPGWARLIPENSNPAQRHPIPSPFPGLARLILENSNPAQRHPIPSPLPGLARLIPENSDPAQKPTFCPQCSGKDQSLLSKQKTQELQRKWRDTCVHIHPNFHQTTHPANPVRLAMPPSRASISNPNSLARPPFQPIKPNLVKTLGSALQLNTGPVTTQLVPPAAPKSPPTSPVQTDLVLGTKGPKKPAEDHQAKDLLSCISSEPMTRNKPFEKFADELDAGTYKNILKGLMENAWWQAEAASAVASAITRCRLGNGKQRGNGRGDTWLLFAGPDRVAKRKMASVLAEQICGSGLVIIGLGPHREDEPETGLRGGNAVDRIAEAVRRNPLSVILLRDIDEAGVIVRGNIKRAIDRGRLTNSYGREIGLKKALFIVTGDWSTVSAEALRDGQFVDERKLNSTAGGSWQLGLIVREKAAKRRANWSNDGGPRTRPRTETGSGGGRSFDLNLSAAAYEEKSIESSEVSAVDGGDDAEPTDGGFSIVSLPHDLATCVDDSIVFRPVEAAFVRREIKKMIAVKFSMDVDENLAIEIGDDVLDKILGGLWHDSTSLEKWVEGVVGPSFEELKQRLPAGDRSNSVVRLVVESDSCDQGKSKGDVVDWLPNSILV
ncbi:Double Clp-N motif-containing P-loop nucleoside triphosphate hydrolases superfamily protein [Striga hermonthica]|uniref:Double Clp-N motif-containing P-loop nucleoside triphosphate hydrolases superfamily protein n=1 Tax=Striga hermonthica TaxID=68872 RepID=A0A9N7RQY7_STRHE|nr:Double Clp-N motif-containing P-loop nucleoside triphosphate hydrolases superfamily protein [Striga hermonthica]